MRTQHTLNTQAAEPGGRLRAEIRTERDVCDEYMSYLVLIQDGKRFPCLHIPDDLPDHILQAALANLNAETPEHAGPRNCENPDCGAFRDPQRNGGWSCSAMAADACAADGGRPEDDSSSD